MCNVFIKFLFFCTCFVELCTIAFGTSLNILKVSQANFLIIKNGTHALVFDCGTKEPGWTNKGKPGEFSEPKKGLLRNMLEGISDVKILISHNHVDHHNLTVPLSNLIADIPEITTNEILKSWEKTDPEICDFVKGILGEGVGVTPLLARGTASNPNDCSVILRLDAHQRKILLTGDATGRIIQAVSKEIGDIDVFLFSHHGSNEAGELSVVEYMKHPLLGIISSDVTGASRIPKFYPNYRDVSQTGEDFLHIVGKKMAMPVTSMTTAAFCETHLLSFHNQLVNSPQIVPSCLVDERGVCVIPVFSTGDLDNREMFYRVDVAPDGEITMTKNMAEIVYKSSSPASTTPARFGHATSSSFASSSFSLQNLKPQEIMRDLIKCVFNLIYQTFQVREKTKAEICMPVLFGDAAMSIEQEANALMRLRHSNYTAETVSLRYLSSLLHEVFLHATGLPSYFGELPPEIDHIAKRASALGFLIEDNSDLFKQSELILRLKLLGTNHLAVDEFLLRFLYKVWKNLRTDSYPKIQTHIERLQVIQSALIQYISHYSHRRGFRPDRSYCYDDRARPLIESITDSVNRDSFAEFLENNLLLKKNTRKGQSSSSDSDD